MSGGYGTEYAVCVFVVEADSLKELWKWHLAITPSFSLLTTERSN